MPDCVAEEIVIHCGLAKTGSTAIQNFCSLNRDALLERHNILVPGDPREHFNFVTLFSEAPCSLVHVRRAGFQSDEKIQAHCTRYRSAIEVEIASARPRVIFITSEYFPSMSAHELAAMREYFGSLAHKVRWVAYVRDPWSFALSLAQEYIRQGRVKGEVRLGYAASNVEMLNHLRVGLGDSFIVRPYLQMGEYRTDILRDFSEVVGFDQLAFRTPSADQSNRAIGRTAACLLAYLNAIYPQFDENDLYRLDGARDWIVEAIIASDSDGDKLKLSRSMAERIFNESASDMALLHEHYFDGVPVFHAAYSPTLFDESSDTISIESVSQEQAINVLFKAMTFLSRRGAHFWHQANALKDATSDNVTG